MTAPKFICPPRRFIGALGARLERERGRAGGSESIITGPSFSEELWEPGLGSSADIITGSSAFHN